MNNFSIISMVSSVLSNCEDLERYNFNNINVYKDGICVSSVDHDVCLNMNLTTCEVYMSVSRPFIEDEEDIPVPSVAHGRLHEACRDIRGMLRAEEEPSSIGMVSGITLEEEPSSVGVVGGITLDEDE